MLINNPSWPSGHTSLGMLWEKRVATFIFLLAIVAADTTEMISCSEVGYATSAALHTLRSGNIPYEFVIVQLELLFDEHLIGSSGGLPFTAIKSNKKITHFDLNKLRAVHTVYAMFDK